MADQGRQELIPLELIESKIFVLRGHRVMLDRDLADLYGVETRALNQAVKRNADRFPSDFMFQLTPAEGKATMALRSQNVILKRGEHVKYAPRVFTEHGAVMLANVLKSNLAVRASIQVVRAFVHLRQRLASSRELRRQLEMLEMKVDQHDTELQEVLRILRELMEPPPVAPKQTIGFVEPRKRR